MSNLCLLSQFMNDLGTQVGGTPVVDGGSELPVPLPSFGAALARMVGSLVIVLGIFAVVLYFLRRRLGTRSPRGNQLQIIESIGIGPRQRLLLVKIGEQQVALATTEESVTVISLAGDNRVATTTTEHSTFAAAWATADLNRTPGTTSPSPDAQNKS